MRNDVSMWPTKHAELRSVTARENVAATAAPCPPLGYADWTERRDSSNALPHRQFVRGEAETYITPSRFYAKQFLPSTKHLDHISIMSSTTTGLPVRSFQEDSNSEPGVYTASNGVPVPHAYEAQRAGREGPLLLQDFHLIDVISHFDRERIPERVVHAKGGGAHGIYRTTHPIPDLCLAQLFGEQTECPVTVRFSTVGGESGSPDCARDPRGFSIKFRTEVSSMSRCLMKR